MKKRLSLLMALMMVLSLVPMSAFAASKPHTSVQTVKTTDKKTISVTFELDKTTSLTGGLVRFELDNAEFTNASPTDVKLATVNGGSDNASSAFSSKAFVTVENAMEAAVGLTPVEATLTMNVKFENSNVGDVKLKVVDEGDTGIGSQTFTIATVTESSSADAAITVEDSETKIGLDGGELSEFEINNFGKLGATQATNKVEIELPEGFEFVTTGTNATIVYVDGNPFNLATPQSNKIVLPNISNNTKSIIVIPSIAPLGNKADLGAVEVTVSLLKDSTDLVAETVAVIGQAVEYDVTMKIVEDGKKEIPSVYGGETKTVKVTLSGVVGSLDTTRYVDFVVDGADVKNIKPSKGEAVQYTTDATTNIVEDGEFSIKPVGDGSKLEFTMDIVTNYDAEGAVTVEASSRDFDLSADAAEVVPMFTVETKITEAKKGETTAIADIVITEAKAGLIKSGKNLSLELDTRKGVEFASKKVTLDSTNKLELDSAAWGKVNTSTVYNVIDIPVTKASYKEPAVITISGVEVTVDGSVADGIIPLVVKYDTNEVKSTDYVKVVKEYSAVTATTVFTIGSKNYTVNGEAKTAVEAPYVQAGRTMLPIRAVAESLGLKVDYNTVTKQITFTNDSKVATLVVGADTMYVNGSPVKLSVPSTLKSDTTFVELRSVATAFGVGIEWDAATKTVTING